MYPYDFSFERETKAEPSSPSFKVLYHDSRSYGHHPDRQTGVRAAKMKFS